MGWRVRCGADDSARVWGAAGSAVLIVFLLSVANELFEDSEYGCHDSHEEEKTKGRGEAEGERELRETEGGRAACCLKMTA